VQLRPHQQQAVSDIERSWRSGNRRVVYQLPTGGGKTHIKSAIAKRAIESGMRVMAIAHRRELVKQISDRFTAFGIPHGIIQAGEPFNIHFHVQVCAVQTLNRRLLQIPIAPDLILIDEAHHAVAGSWLQVMEHWPNALVLGVTATPERLDGKGLGHVFNDLICGPTVTELQKAGFLAKFRYLAPPKNLAFLQEMRKARTLAGDYQRNELEVAVNKRAIVGNAMAYYEKHLNGRPAIAFCVGIKHAEAVAEQFTAAGWRAASVDGSMDVGTRNRILGDFAAGRLSLLTSADLISEGFDVPDCAGAMLLRPTKSLTIFLQQVGRALRPKSDGSDAVIIDHAGNVYDHGLPADPHDWSLDGKKGREKDQLRVTQCAKCYRVFGDERVSEARAQAQCPDGVEGQWNKCGLYKPPAGSGDGRELLHVDGELIELSVDELYAMDRPVWAGGLSLSLATGYEWETLLARADSMDKLHEIAKARGYKPGWAFHQWKNKARRAAPVSY
jgi:DNA repair protein RadD